MSKKAALTSRGVSRRGFLAIGGITSIVVLTGCGGGDTFTPFSPAVDKTLLWRLSTRHVPNPSKASQHNAANKRFVSAQAAALGRAHPGDSAHIVSLDIKPGTWEQYFGSGADVVDLRHV